MGKSAARLYVAQRRIFIIAQREIVVLNFAQPGSERARRLDPHPDRERVDHHADHRFDAVDRRVAPGVGAEDDVVGSRVASELHGESALQHSIQRHVLLLREAAQVRAEVARQFANEAAMAVPSLRGRDLLGEQRRPLQAAEALARQLSASRRSWRPSHST